MNCPSCQAEVAPGLAVCPLCKAQLHTNPYSSPEQRQPAAGTEEYGGVIPYKNPKALIAYYLGLFSLLPLIGFFLGIAALILGIMGLIDRNKRPEIKGHVHAGIGIGCGAISTLVWGALILFLIIGLAAGA